MTGTNKSGGGPPKLAGQAQGGEPDLAQAEGGEPDTPKPNQGGKPGLAQAESHLHKEATKVVMCLPEAVVAALLVEAARYGLHQAIDFLAAFF